MTKFLKNADVTGYISQTSVTSSLLKTDSSGKLVAATAGTDYQAPTTALLPAGGTAGQILSKIDATNYNTQWIDNFANQLKHEVKLGATLTKGTPVYVSSSNGTNMIVSAASNATEATSSKTLGLLETGGVTNDLVKVITEGLLSGLDTSTATAGDPVWLGPSGTLLYGLANKPVAPVHMVFIGIVTRVQSVNGEIFVKVQNGFELEELHNVAISSVANNQGLFYESATSLWKNKTIATVLGYTPVDASLTANYVPKATGATTLANSNIQDSGSLITLGSRSLVNGLFRIGTDSANSYQNFILNKNLTGGTSAYGFMHNGVIQSDVTSTVYGINSFLNTAASAFTLGTIFNFYSGGVTLGAGSSVTTQIGYYVPSTFTSATNNYGFLGDIIAASGRWNLYMAGSASNYLAGSLGIGATNLTGVNLFISKTITGSIDSYSVNNNGTVQSDVTSSATYFRSGASTAAASFALGSLYHFVANQGTIGAGSSIGTQVGYRVNNNLTGATNNYGFFGDLSSATGVWNLYMNGTAANYLAGNLSIGTTSGGNASLRIAKTVSGSATSFGVDNQSIFQSDVQAGIGYNTYLGTQATTFTLTDLIYYRAAQGVFGAGSTVTAQYGFFAQNTLTGATNNFGFYGQLGAASNAWNLYMAGAANNYLAGSLGIGSTVLTGFSLRMTKVITGATTSYAVSQEGAVQSDVTSAYGFRNFLNTQAATFTLTNYVHYDAAQNPLGTNSSVTNQFGFSVGSSLSGATNNYGFYSNLTAASGRWNLYMNGNANNYMAGNLFIGATNPNGWVAAVVNTKSLTGGTSVYGYVADATIQSDVTNTVGYFRSQSTTAAATFTLTNLNHFVAVQATFGAGSSVTTQRGFWAQSSLVGATNDYGFQGSLPAGTNNWNLYMDGTAQNYLAGALSIGVTTANASALLQLDSTTKGFLPPRMTSAQRTAISSAATGLIVYQTDGVEGLWLNTSAGWKELTVV